jgi:hypothetical protein
MILDPDTPDSVFLNWISFHENGDVALYPMFAENRRAERREEILDLLEERGLKLRISWIIQKQNKMVSS